MTWKIFWTILSKYVEIWWWVKKKYTKNWFCAKHPHLQFIMSQKHLGNHGKNWFWYALNCTTIFWCKEQSQILCPLSCTSEIFRILSSLIYGCIPTIWWISAYSYMSFIWKSKLSNVYLQKKLVVVQQNWRISNWK